MTNPRLPVRWLELDERGTIVLASGVGELVGLADDALVGTALLDRLPMAERIFVQTHVMPGLAVDGRVDEVYLNLRHLDGGSTMTLASLQRRRDGDDVRDVVALMPMRRRRLYEHELLSARDAAARSSMREHEARASEQEVRARLAAAERLASLGQASAAFAHELNNPLAYVSANVELLTDQLASHGGTEAILHDLREGVGRMRAIIDGLRKMSRVEGGRRQPIDLGRVVASTLQVAAAALRGRATVEVELGRPPPWALADEGAVGQILLNLVVNAAQAMSGDQAASNRIRVSAARHGDAVDLTVSDNGPGIPPALRARIFEPFFTTKAIGEGTGLGLSVCRDLASSLGGSIELLDPAEAPRGATFRLRLLAAEPPTPVTEAPVAATASSRTAPRVLLVEDEPAIARALTRVLVGSQVTWVPDGAEAWAAFERDGLAAYDVVMCDLSMPVVTGMELYRRIHARSPETAARMVFVTGGTPVEGAQAFLASVHNPRLSKPFDLRVVRQVVQAMLASKPAG